MRSLTKPDRGGGRLVDRPVMSTQPATPQTPVQPPFDGNPETPISPGGGNLGPAQATQMPWLQAWEGPFAAPKSPLEAKGQSGLENWADQGFGLGQAQDYLGRVFGGDYLSGNDPNFQAIQESGETLKQMEDDRALREIASGYAAGGNALSGARMGTEADYLRGSNAQFQNLMSQLRAANYGRERGFQQDAVQGARGLSGDVGRGWGALMGAGSLDRDIANQEIGGQYGDFLRQGQEFKDAYRYPDQMGMQLMNQGYPGYNRPLFGESDASQLGPLLAQIFGGGGGLGAGIGDFFGGLIGSASSDGVPGYDGEEPPKPTSYRDSQAYNQALTAMQAKNAAERAKTGKASNANKAMTLLALLAQVLGIGGGGRTKSKGGGGGGGGQSLGSKAGEGLGSLLFPNKKKSLEGPQGENLSYKTNKKTGAFVPGSLKGQLETRKGPSGIDPGAVDSMRDPFAGEGLLGDSTDWASQSDYNLDSNDPFIDSQLFGSGDVGDVWSNLFESDPNRDLGFGSSDLGQGGGYDPLFGGGDQQFDLGNLDFGNLDSGYQEPEFSFDNSQSYWE